MGRWRWSLGFAFVFGVACGESTRHVPAPAEGGGEAGEGHAGSLNGAGGGGDASSTGGAAGAGGDDHSEAGSSRGGTAGKGGSSAGRGPRAGEAGEPAVGGRAGRDAGMDCPPSDAGQAGETGDVLWVGRPDRDAEPPLCVPDCSSADYAPAERAGCDWACPEAAPVLAETCEIGCDWRVTCGPSLYCSRWTQAYSNATDICIYEEFEDSRCSCLGVPESCVASESDRPVCGQDGVTYPSLCEAHRARTDLVGYGYDATCTLDDEKYFKCGGVFCERGSEYCSIEGPLDDNDLDDFNCVVSPCAESGGCACALADFEPESDPEDPHTCTEPEPGAVIVEDRFVID